MRRGHLRDGAVAGRRRVRYGRPAEQVPLPGRGKKRSKYGPEQTKRSKQAEAGRHPPEKHRSEPDRARTGQKLVETGQKLVKKSW